MPQSSDFRFDFGLPTYDRPSSTDAIGLGAPAAQERAPISVVDRITDVESGGDPTAKNPDSTATGLGQFIESTWMDMLGKYRPDLLEGRTRQQVLKLRENGPLSKEMTDHYKTENTEHLRKLGIPSTPDTTYLAHFLGPDGAANVLRAPAGTPVSRLLTSRAISSNTSVLKGKTNSQVIAWAKRKMSGGGAKAPADPMEARFQELEAAEPGRYQLIYEDEYDAWHAEWQTKRDEEPGGFSRGFVTTMLEQNPNLTGEALEGFSYLAPEGMQKMLLDASVDLKSLAKDATPEEYKLRSGSLWDVESLDDFGTWIAEASGQGVASSVPSMITGTGGMLVGKRIAGKTGGIGGALAGAAVPSFGFNYGEVYAALKHEKIAPDAAAAVALYAAVPMAMLDSLPVGAVLTRMGGMKEIKRQVARNIARRIAAEGAKGMGREGITEAAQEAIKEAAVAIKADKPFFTLETVGRVAESGVAGMAAGGPMAAPAGIRRDQVAAAEAPGVGEVPEAAPAQAQATPAEATPPKPAGPLTRAVSKAPEGAGASVGPGQLAQLERDDGSYTPVQVQNIEDGWANIKDEAGEEHQVPIEMLSPLASTPEVAEPAPAAPAYEAPGIGSPAPVAEEDVFVATPGAEAAHTLNEFGKTIGLGTREAPVKVETAEDVKVAELNVDTAPTDAEFEIPDFLKRTSEKAKKTKKTIYRGSGRADRGSVYNEHAPAVPILGEGRYFAFNEEAAKRYGPDIETSELSLENPLTVTSGEQWRSLTKEAGWKVPNPFGQGVAETKKRTEAMRALVLSKGHDGVIVQWDDSLLTDVGADGENIKLLRNVFGDPQIVDYREPEKQGEARADEPLRTVEQDLEAARPKFDDYISGKATLRRLRFAVGVDQGAVNRLLDAAVEDGRLLKSKKGVYRRKPANYDENIAKLKASAASRRKDKVPTGPKKPVVAMLKKAGGVDPTSTLAGELRAMGINLRTAPGLFKRGGIGAVDNFVASEHPLFENDGDERGYIKPEVLMDALAGEQAGNPRVLQEQKDAEAEEDNAAQEADARAEIEEAMKFAVLKGDSELSAKAFSLYAQGDISADDAVERAVIQLGEDSTSETDAEADQDIPFGDTEPGPARAPVEGLPQDGDEGRGAGGAEEAVPASEADTGRGQTESQAPRQGEFLGTEEISDAELAQRKSDEGLKAKADQLPADQGLFSDDSKQTDLVKVAEESAKATSTYGAYGASNKLVTQERAEVLRARLKAKLKGELRSGIDPEILAIGTELTVFHIEAGSRRFMDVAKALAGDLDTEIGKLRPFLRGWYNGARDMMEDTGADIAGMDDADAVRAALPELGEEPAARGKADRLAGTDAAKVEAVDIFPSLMAGGQAQLANGWTLKRSLVAGEQRIELVGPATFSEGEEIKADGALSERIEYRTRYFIPTNKADGERTIAALTKHRPVVELGDGGQAQTGIDLDDFEEVGSTVPHPKLDAKQRKGLEAAMRAKVRKIAGKDIPVELYPFLSGEGSAVYQSDMSRFENAGGRRAGTQGGSASVWSNGRALVKLATADPAFDPMDSAAHEAYHVTAALMQTDAERAVINKDMKRIRAFAAEELGLAADSDAIASLPSYEAEAIAYQRYDRMRDAGLPLSKIKGIPRPVMLFFERVRRLVAEIKKVLTGKGFDRFEDVFEDTYQGRMPARERTHRTFKEMGSSATNPEDDLAVRFLQTLAEEDELFAYPRSTSGDLKQVFTDIDPQVKFMGENTSPEEARESGADQKFLLRSANGKDFYVFQTEDKVWIDVSALPEGGGGAGVYAAVGDYARNTGRVFVGDPAGITDVAMRRRTENMLSQALRHGTTAHLEPHPDQLEGNAKIGIPPLRWQSGDDVGNIRSLIQTSIGSLEHYVPEIKDARYDFDSGTFRTGEGEPISDGRFKDWHTSGGGRKAGAGRATLKRGILLNTVLRAPRGDLAGLLERSLRFQDKHVAGTELQQTFYSSISSADVGTARAADSILGRVPADAEIEGMAEDGGLEVGDVRIAPLGGELVKLNVQGAFESASDKLRRTKNPLLIDLASRVDRYFDEREARVGWINGRVRPILKRLGIGSVTTKDMVKKVTEPFEEYWRHHDNGRSAEAVLAEAQPAVRDLVEEVKAIYSDIGDLNQKSGVKVFDAALKSWRPIGKVRAGKFWPRLLRPDVQRVLQNPSNDPELWSDMVDALINDGHIETRDEALKYVKNYFTEETRSDYFAGIEKARSRALPEIFYDYSWQAFQRYTWRWTARISQIDQFGQITTAQTKDSFGKVMESTLDSRTQKYVREAENRVYEKRSGDLYETIMGHLNLLATGIMLGNWATATLNLLGGTTLNAQMFGATRMTKAYAKLATDWKNVQQTGVEYGILGKDVLNILRDTEQTSGTYFDVNSRLHDGLAVFAKQTMTWGGYRGTENIIRATAMIAGWTQLQDSLHAWNQNLTSAKSLKYRAFMQRNRIDSDKLLAENGAGPETSRYMRLMVNIPQGSYRIDQVPIYVDTPLGRFFFKYQKFGTQVSRMFWQNFLKPFIATVQGGEAVTVAGAEKRVKTFLPMFRYLVYGFVGGSAILAARSAMFNYNDPGPDWEDLLEALKDDDRARMWGMIFDRAYSSWMAASFAGFFGNYIQMGRDFHDKQRVKNPLEPPGLASIDAVMELFLRWREQGTITARDLDQIGERTLSFYRASKRAGLTALSVAGSELREARLLDAYRDRNYVRKATRMYADEMGIANRRTSSGRFGKNEMSPTNQRIYEALMLGDAESARAIVRDALRGETAAERKKLKASMQSSARARQPIRIAGGGTKAERAAFLRWSRKKLAKSNSQRVQDTHRRYLRAAVRTGLMNP